MTRKIIDLGQLTVPITTDWLKQQPALVCFQYQHCQTYLPGEPVLKLNVLLHQTSDQIRVLVSDSEPNWPVGESDIETEIFEQAAANHPTSVIDLLRPLPLEPVYIPKPWGREIWFTGIEARGVSLMAGVPIAWLIDLFGDLLGCRAAPLLLKILDPFADENLGDLYFEMHQQKVEVYVVTNIDDAAWPAGEGGIRYGFDQSRVEALGDRGFLDQYVATVKAYEVVRNDIDAVVSELKSEAGVARDEPLLPEAQQAFLKQVPAELQQKEQQLRSDMYAFTNMHPLRLGDVVTVPPFVPHSLQHGVRVVEFQTPHYERFILSFGQQVLTQNHWDTGEVFAHAKTRTPPIAEPETIAPGADLVTNFDAFHVLRVKLSPEAEFRISSSQYTILMGIKGELMVTGEGKEGDFIQPEQAIFCQAGIDWTITNRGKEEACLLIAQEGPFQRDRSAG